MFFVVCWFFSKSFFPENLSGVPLESQQFGSRSGPMIDLGPDCLPRLSADDTPDQAQWLIWVQTVCQGYQQMTLQIRPNDWSGSRLFAKVISRRPSRSGQMIDLGPDCLPRLSADDTPDQAQWLIWVQTVCQGYQQKTLQIRPNDWSGSRLFAKVISRWHSRSGPMIDPGPDCLPRLSADDTPDQAQWLIWVQTVCQGYQQITLQIRPNDWYGSRLFAKVISRWHSRSGPMIDLGPDCLPRLSADYTPDQAQWLIWVQTVCQGYQQKTLQIRPNDWYGSRLFAKVISRWHSRSGPMIDLGPDCLPRLSADDTPDQAQWLIWVQTVCQGYQQMTLQIRPNDWYGSRLFAKVISRWHSRSGPMIDLGPDCLPRLSADDTPDQAQWLIWVQTVCQGYQQMTLQIRPNDWSGSRLFAKVISRWHSRSGPMTDLGPNCFPRLSADDTPDQARWLIWVQTVSQGYQQMTLQIRPDNWSGSKLFPKVISRWHSRSGPMIDQGPNCFPRLSADDTPDQAQWLIRVQTVSQGYQQMTLQIRPDDWSGSKLFPKVISRWHSRSGRMIDLGPNCFPRLSADDTPDQARWLIRVQTVSQNYQQMTLQIRPNDWSGSRLFPKVISRWHSRSGPMIDQGPDCFPRLSADDTPDQARWLIWVQTVCQGYQQMTLQIRPNDWSGSRLFPKVISRWHSRSGPMIDQGPNCLPRLSADDTPDQARWLIRVQTVSQGYQQMTLQIRPNDWSGSKLFPKVISRWHSRSGPMIDQGPNCFPRLSADDTPDQAQWLIWVQTVSQGYQQMTLQIRPNDWSGSRLLPKVISRWHSWSGPMIDQGPDCLQGYQQMTLQIRPNDWSGSRLFPKVISRWHSRSGPMIDQGPDCFPRLSADDTPDQAQWLIWVQTVSQGYQQMTLLIRPNDWSGSRLFRKVISRWHSRSGPMIGLSPDCFQRLSADDTPDQAQWLIWVQTVCQGYQQMTLLIRPNDWSGSRLFAKVISRWHSRSGPMIDQGPDCFPRLSADDTPDQAQWLVWVQTVCQGYQQMTLQIRPNDWSESRLFPKVISRWHSWSGPMTDLGPDCLPRLSAVDTPDQAQWLIWVQTVCQGYQQMTLQIRPNDWSGSRLFVKVISRWHSRSGPMIDLGPDCLPRLSADDTPDQAQWLIWVQTVCQGYQQKTLQIRPNDWSGSRLFAKVISRRPSRSGPMIDLGPDCLPRLSADDTPDQAQWLIWVQTVCQGYQQKTLQIRPNDWSGSRLFANVISRRPSRSGPLIDLGPDCLPRLSADDTPDQAQWLIWVQTVCQGYQQMTLQIRPNDWSGSRLFAKVISRWHSRSGPMTDLGPDCLPRLSAEDPPDQAQWLIWVQTVCQCYQQKTLQIRPIDWSGSRLFAKVISRWHSRSGPMIDLGPDCLPRLSADDTPDQARWLIWVQTVCQGYQQMTLQIRPNDWSGSRLFAKVISRRHSRSGSMIDLGPDCLPRLSADDTPDQAQLLIRVQTVSQGYQQMTLQIRPNDWSGSRLFAKVISRWHSRSGPMTDLGPDCLPRLSAEDPPDQAQWLIWVQTVCQGYQQKTLQIRPNDWSGSRMFAKVISRRPSRSGPMIDLGPDCLPRLSAEDPPDQAQWLIWVQNVCQGYQQKTLQIRPNDWSGSRMFAKVISRWHSRSGPMTDLGPECLPRLSADDTPDQAQWLIWVQTVCQGYQQMTLQIRPNDWSGSRLFAKVISRWHSRSGPMTDLGPECLPRLSADDPPDQAQWLILVHTVCQGYQQMTLLIRPNDWSGSRLFAKVISRWHSRSGPMIDQGPDCFPRLSADDTPDQAQWLVWVQTVCQGYQQMTLQIRPNDWSESRLFPKVISRWHSWSGPMTDLGPDCLPRLSAVDTPDQAQWLIWVQTVCQGYQQMTLQIRPNDWSGSRLFVKVISRWHSRSGPMIDLGPDCLPRLSADDTPDQAQWLIWVQTVCQGYQQKTLQIRPNDWSGSRLFAKVISRRPSRSGPMIDLGPDCLPRLSADDTPDQAQWLIWVQTVCQGYQQKTLQIRPNDWSGSRLFANVISRRPSRSGPLIDLGPDCLPRLSADDTPDQAQWLIWVQTVCQGYQQMTLQIRPNDWSGSRLFAKVISRWHSRSGPMTDLGPDCLPRLSAEDPPDQAQWLIWVQTVCQCYQQKTLQIRPIDWSGSRLFAKVISRWHSRSGPMIDLGPDCLPRLSADDTPDQARWLIWVQTVCQGYQQMTLQIRPNDWSGSRLFAKVISRRHSRSGSMIDLGPDCLPRLSADDTPDQAQLLIRVQTVSQGYQQMTLQIRPNDWSGSRLFAKVISRWHSRSGPMTDLGPDCLPRLSAEDPPDQAQWLIWVQTVCQGYQQKTLQIRPNDWSGSRMFAKVISRRPSRSGPMIDLGPDCLPRLSAEDPPDQAQWLIWVQNVCQGYQQKTLQIRPNDWSGSRMFAKVISRWHSRSGPMTDLGPECLPRLSADDTPDQAQWLIWVQTVCQGYQQMTLQIRPNDWSGSRLFAKVISRWHSRSGPMTDLGPECLPRLSADDPPDQAQWLIWVQNVCQGYQQMTLQIRPNDWSWSILFAKVISRRPSRSGPMTDLGPECLPRLSADDTPDQAQWLIWVQTVCQGYQQMTLQIRPNDWSGSRLFAKVISRRPSRSGPMIDLGPDCLPRLSADDPPDQAQWLILVQTVCQGYQQMTLQIRPNDWSGSRLFDKVISRWHSRSGPMTDLGPDCLPRLSAEDPPDQAQWLIWVQTVCQGYQQKTLQIRPNDWSGSRLFAKVISRWHSRSGPMIDLGPDCLPRLSADYTPDQAQWLIWVQTVCQGYQQITLQIRPNDWSGSRLFAKVISRRHSRSGPMIDLGPDCLPRLSADDTPDQAQWLIWVQTVCQGYQQKTLAGKELMVWKF